MKLYMVTLLVNDVTALETTNLIVRISSVDAVTAVAQAGCRVAKRWPSFSIVYAKVTEARVQEVLASASLIRVLDGDAA